MVKLLHILILGKAKAIIRRYLAGWGTSMVTAGFAAGDGSKHDTTKADRSQHKHVRLGNSKLLS